MNQSRDPRFPFPNRKTFLLLCDEKKIDVTKETARSKHGDAFASMHLKMQLKNIKN
jgi:hypothetical protein